MLQWKTLIIHHSCCAAHLSWLNVFFIMSFMMCLLHCILSHKRLDAFQTNKWKDGWVLTRHSCARRISTPQIESENYITTRLFHPRLECNNNYDNNNSGTVFWGILTVCWMRSFNELVWSERNSTMEACMQTQWIDSFDCDGTLFPVAVYIQFALCISTTLSAFFEQLTNSTCGRLWLESRLFLQTFTVHFK